MQLTFESERADRRRPRPATRLQREAAHTVAITAATRAATPRTTERHRALNQLREHLIRYICQLGIRQEFQAADFHKWMIDTKRIPRKGGALDARATGAMFLALRRLGVLEIVGHRTNAGCRATGYHPTLRPVYRVIVLDFSRFNTPGGAGHG